MKLRVLDIARAARSKAEQGQEKLKRAYGQLLNSTGRVASVIFAVAIYMLARTGLPSWLSIR